VTDAGLPHLRVLKDLKTLSLGSSQVTDAGLPHLRDLKDLRKLSLYGTQVTDAGLARLRDFPNLGFLNLGNTRVTDAGLAHLAGCGKLTTLILKGTKVTAAGVAKLAKVLPHCRFENDHGVVAPVGDRPGAEWVLSVGGKVRINDRPAEITAAAGLPAAPFAVTEANLAGATATDADLERLRTMIRVKTLLLTGTGVTDAGLEHLTGLDSLATLDLGGTKVTAAGVAKLAKPLPYCRITSDHGVIEPAKVAAFSPLDPAWAAKVKTLPPDDQVKEVAEELERRNPGFDPASVRHLTDRGAAGPGTPGPDHPGGRAGHPGRFRSGVQPGTAPGVETDQPQRGPQLGVRPVPAGRDAARRPDRLLPTRRRPHPAPRGAAEGPVRRGDGGRVAGPAGGDAAGTAPVEFDPGDGLPTDPRDAAGGGAFAARHPGSVVAAPVREDPGDDQRQADGRVLEGVRRGEAVVRNDSPAVKRIPAEFVSAPIRRKPGAGFPCRGSHLRRFDLPKSG
jgi:hypothetical protein